MLVDYVAPALPFDRHRAERAHDAGLQGRLLADLAHDGPIERFAGFDAAARQRPGALGRRTAPANDDHPTVWPEADRADGDNRIARLRRPAGGVGGRLGSAGIGRLEGLGRPDGIDHRWRVRRANGHAASIVKRSRAQTGCERFAMVGLDLVRPLEDDWRDTLDEVARGRGWPTSRDVARLAARVAALSDAYNDPGRARASVRDAGAARLGFSFARDVPKGSAAVRELVAAGVLGAQSPVEVLDVGAGLGAMTWGLARAIDRAACASTALDATWIDADPEALDLGLAIARARQGRGRVDLRARAVAGPLSVLDGLGRYDVVLVGHVLSEIGVDEAEDVRIERHVALLRRLLDRHTRDHGSLVVVEPALQDRTRRLHRTRDRLVELGLTVFAPCLHAAPCPALTRDSDWCHENVPIDLPAWLVPVARAAGLRREGLTYSYLVLRRDGVRLVDALSDASSHRLRVVSDRIVSKGKCEAFLCGDFRGPDGTYLPARGRVMRLDRAACAANLAWDTVARGDVVSVDPPLDLDRARVGPSSSVRHAGVVAPPADGVA